MIRLLPLRLPGRFASLVALPLLALCGLAIAPSAARAQPMEEIFADANRAYYRGDLEAAIAGYERLVSAGTDDADVHFDLGTAYAGRGEFGRAILSFERALRLDPADAGALAGIHAAKEALGRRRAEAEGEAVVHSAPPLSETLVSPFPEPLLAWLVLVLDILLFSALIARTRTRSEPVRLGLGVAAPLTALLLILALAGLGIRRGTFARGERAVILSEGATLREGPDPRARGRGRVLEGERGWLLDRQGEFVEIALDGDRRGWLNEAEAAEVAPR